MVSVVAATYCGYFVSNKLCIAVFCLIRPFQPQLWSWPLYFITMVPLSERSPDEYADTYFKAIYCQVA